MSSHFTYEIDERNLRTVFRKEQLPYSEEAWQKFEAYLGTQVINNQTNTFQRFQIPLNRSVLLPVLFVGVVIGFAVILFNFVNIKNPSNADGNTDNPNKTVVTFPEEQKQPESDLQQEPLIKQEPKKPVMATPVKTVNPTLPELAKKTETVYIKPATPQKTLTTPVITPPKLTTQTLQVNKAAPVIVSNTVAPEPVKKKRRRRAEAIIDNPGTPETRPNIGEEREPEDRPN